MQSASQGRRLSTGAAVVVLFFVLLFIIATVWLLRVSIELFVLAALVALAVSHPINWLASHGVPRLAAVVGILLCILAVIIVLGIVFVPRLATEAADFASKMPSYFDDLRARLVDLSHQYPWLQTSIASMNLSSEVTKRAQAWLTQGWSLAIGVAGGVVMAILVFITIIFMLLNPQPLIKGVFGIVPEPWDERARHIAALMADRLRAWLRGLVILGGVIGIFVGAGLSLIGVPYAILFGVLAGLLEMIPTVGPVLSAIPPILVALAVEPIKALYVGLLFIVVQQAENILLVPLVMRRQLDLHPVSIIFGFIALGTLFGLFGAIISVPAVACLKVLYDELYYPWAHPGELAGDQAALTETAADVPAPAEITDSG